MAPPPPSTPAQQPRFLLSKRQAPAAAPSQPRQGRTPGSGDGDAGSGARRFRATPRFSLPSTPRPSRQPAAAAATPLPPLSTARRPPRGQARRHDAIESSPRAPSTPGAAAAAGWEGEEEEEEGGGRGGGGQARGRRLGLAESIEVEDGSSSAWSSQRSPRTGAGEAEDAYRTPKRRRISISPDGGASSQATEGRQPREGAVEAGGADWIEEGGDTDDDEHVMADAMDYDDDDDDDGPALWDDASPDPIRAGGAESPAHDEPGDRPGLGSGRGQQQQQQQHTAFRRPPRFKTAVEAPDNDGAAHPLPGAFSPQRRGAEKYLPGGLAAELRDWLVQVKGGGGGGGGDGDGQPGGGVRTVDVEAARPGPGWWLVAGRRAGAGAEAVRVVLAGDGRAPPAGLGGAPGGAVAAGARVAVMQPAWDAVLGERGPAWVVACDWAVVRDEGEAE